MCISQVNALVVQPCFALTHSLIESLDSMGSHFSASIEECHETGGTDLVIEGHGIKKKEVRSLLHQLEDEVKFVTNTALTQNEHKWSANYVHPFALCSACCLCRVNPLLRTSKGPARRIKWCEAHTK